MITRSPLLWLFVTCVHLLLVNPCSHAEESFFKSGDVVALVGGEDMVSAAEYGYLETYLTRALPNYKLKFRSLAWEGDTVFEQRRDLNYPTLEQQLDKIGATVVIAQFGQMESFAGKEKVREFIAAYEKLLLRLENGGKRRVLVLIPPPFVNPRPLTNDEHPLLTNPPDWEKRNEDLAAYRAAIVESGRIPGLQVPGKWHVLDLALLGADVDVDAIPFQRDGIHLNNSGNMALAREVARLAVGSPMDVQSQSKRKQVEQLRKMITSKNRLWFNYYRPQNWAFLAGDRTNQPSSRDHLDPNKRWFPEELEQFLPLIEQKETEIHELAATLANP